jgi:acetylornithine deacetylase/succinyl-diaminopimelate desuccinylase-like protein
MQAVAQSLGWPRMEFVPSTGTSDMRHFAARGIPCVLFGPGRGFNPHRANEHYYLDDLPKMTTLLLGMIERWCA